MRDIPLFLTVLLAGCASSPPTSDAEDGGPADLPRLPSDVLIEATMPPSYGGLPAFPSTPPPPCTQEPLQVCHFYPFDLARTANVSVELRWFLPHNDLDVYIFQDGQSVAFPNVAVSTLEAHRALLGPGHYEFAVQGYTSTADPSAVSVGTMYTLRAFFDEP